jgi:hypothetical protein
VGGGGAGVGGGLRPCSRAASSLNQSRHSASGARSRAKLQRCLQTVIRDHRHSAPASSARTCAYYSRWPKQSGTENNPPPIPPVVPAVYAKQFDSGQHPRVCGAGDRSSGVAARLRSPASAVRPAVPTAPLLLRELPAPCRRRWVLHPGERNLAHSTPLPGSPALSLQ